MMFSYSMRTYPFSSFSGRMEWRCPGSTSTKSPSLQTRSVMSSPMIPEPFLTTMISAVLCQCSGTEVKSSGIVQGKVLYGKSSLVCTFVS